MILSFMIQITNSSKKGNLLKNELTNLRNNKYVYEEQKVEANRKEIEKIIKKKIYI